MTLRVWVNAILGIAAVCTLVLLYFNVQSIDLKRHQEMMDISHHINELVARWNENVLAFKLQPDADSDPLANSLRELERLEQRLKALVAEAFVDNTEMQSLLAKHQTEIAEKARLSEKFILENKILRDSLRLLPTAIRDARAVIAQAATRAGINTKLEILELQAHELAYELLEFSLQRNEKLNQQILTRIEQLAATGRDFNGSIHDPLDIALGHARTILQQKPVVDELVAAILALSTAQSIAQLQSEFFEVNEQRLLKNDQYQFLLIIFSVLLLAWVGFIGWSLRKSYRALDLANEELQQANENLEQRVMERTDELSIAYYEVQQSQARLIQSEKMASLGQMVAGVVHEINTPLAYSRSNVEMVEEQLPELSGMVSEIGYIGDLLAAPDPDMEIVMNKLVEITASARTLIEDEVPQSLNELLQASISGHDQISELVINLKNFSRLDRKKVERVDLNKGLDSVLLIARNTLKHKVDIEKNYQELPLVACSPSQINQVFLNLIVNAAQAIEDHGTIRLITQVQNDLVQVIIEDDGNGIADDTLPHIFDPFFTTKSIGEGSGMGLSIAYQIIEQHQGAITVDSKLDEGTRFTISLPITLQAEQPQQEAA